ncbi:MAG: L-glutamate gamma-semialdehyde dehydrogenase [Dehalococcoidia bacterium]|nr:MAG: L-glutamate gamma-semialdehyde dehydrogenase [Dehalococcoidia bacterium]
MPEPSLDTEVESLAERLAAAGRAANGVLLSPRWFQQQVLERATADPAFRTQLLRFVDVLPALRTPAAVADHVQQYFEGLDAPLVAHVTEWASHATFRPILSRLVRLGVVEMAHRFIVGESPRVAQPRLEGLARAGIGHTIDLLGEACLSDAEADAYQRRYLDLIDFLAGKAERLAPRGPIWDGVPGLNVSLKYSAFAPHFEPAAPERVGEVIMSRLRPVLQRAVQHGVFINVDMEQYRFKNLTHHTFARQVSDPEFVAYPHVGIVVQAYLRDALEDIAWLRALAERRGAPITVRLVKGAYWDEERAIASQNGWPVPVYQRKAETDESFERCTDALLDAWPALRPAFGSHNPRSIAQAAVKARRRGMDKREIEFQVLYGMAEGIRETLAEEGYRTRVYVPVGAIIPGMAYLVRRLLENTSNEAWFNTSAAIRSAPIRPAEPVERPSAAFANASSAPFFDPAVRERMRAALARRRIEQHPLRIGERVIAGRASEQIRSPADPSRVVGEVAQATPEDVAAAVGVAAAAFPSWRDRPVAERAALLRRTADLMEARRFDLAALMVAESGKPWAEADGDVAEALDYLRYYAGEAERVLAPRTLGSVLGERNVYRAEPRGVAAVIAPWNFPLAIVTGMTVAALVTGNCAIVKPAEQSPLIALRLVALLHEAGVPPEVVQCLPGPGETVGRALVEHPSVDLVAFTGSSAVGQAILAEAVRPRGRGFKKVIAEMGGKNAIIVDDDADLDQAIAGTIVSAYGFAGQKCSAASRLIVVGSAYRELVERLVPAVESLSVGPPEDPYTFVPPVISAEARARIGEAIAWGKAHARLLAAAPIPEGAGWYVSPVLFGDAPEEGPLAQEEIFGPVLALFHVPDFAAALRLAMSVPYALTGGVYSRNPRHLEAATREFRVGNLYLNRKITGAVVGRQPFGGLGISGIGEKAGGPDYLRQFLEPRVVTENTMRRGFVPESA